MPVNPSEGPAPTGGRPRFLDRATPPHVVTLVMLSGLAALTMNVFLPSLPGIAEYYSADYAVVQLAVSAYLAVMALVQIAVGPLSDRYGRRSVTIWCLLAFCAATLACIFAPTIETFLAARMAQAVVSAAFVVTRAAVRDMVQPDQAASMIGYITMGMTLMPMIGPVLGGYLDEIFGWQASFAVLLVYGALAVLWSAADMGETNRLRSASFTEQFRGYPELATSRRFWGYALSAAFASGAFLAFLGGSPYVATVILGMSPSAVGYYFGFTGIGYLLGNYISGRYATAIGINRMMLVGQICAAVGSALSIGLFAVGLGSPAAFFGPIFFIGLGNGITLPSANAGIVSVRPALAGSAAGFGSALTIGGGAGLSTLAGFLLGPETGPYPLQLIMLVTSVAGIAASAYVIRVAHLVRRQEQGG